MRPAWHSKDDLVVPASWPHGVYAYRARHYMHPSYIRRDGRDGYSRLVKQSYTFHSFGLVLCTLKASLQNLDRDEWKNFHHDPLPCNTSSRMTRREFYAILPWLRHDFSRWTVEAVPESGTNLIDDTIEYRLGFDTEKDCAIFVLYRDAILAGDVPISYPEKPARKRLRVV